MILDPKLLACAGLSLVAHVVLERALEHLPKRPDPPPEKIEVRVEVRPPAEPARAPEPEPPKPKPPEPQPQKPPPPRIVTAPPRQRVAPPPVAQAPVPHDTPPVDHATTTGPTTDQPIRGITMESTSSAGGPAMPVGNTTHPIAGTAPTTTAPAPLAAPVASYEATKTPLPQGRCAGKYTDEARAAGDEGVVILDLTVGADGHARDIDVQAGLPHGLTEAAIAALRDCSFTPGERDGQPVAVRVKGFKIRFVLDEP
jgi:protein TonB